MDTLRVLWEYLHVFYLFTSNNEMGGHASGCYLYHTKYIKYLCLNPFKSTHASTTKVHLLATPIIYDEVLTIHTRIFRSTRSLIKYFIG